MLEMNITRRPCRVILDINTRSLYRGALATVSNPIVR